VVYIRDFTSNEILPYCRSTELPGRGKLQGLRWNQNDTAVGATGLKDRRDCLLAQAIACGRIVQPALQDSDHLFTAVGLNDREASNIAAGQGPRSPSVRPR
jgi:hypothetical protein